MSSKLALSSLLLLSIATVDRSIAMGADLSTSKTPLHDVVAASMAWNPLVGAANDAVDVATKQLKAAWSAILSPGIAVNYTRTKLDFWSNPPLPESDLPAAFTHTFTAGAGYLVCGSSISTIGAAKVGAKVAAISKVGARNTIAGLALNEYATLASAAEQVQFLKFVQTELTTLASKLPDGSDKEAVATEATNTLEAMVELKATIIKNTASFWKDIGLAPPNLDFSAFTPDDAQAYWHELGLELKIPASFGDVVRNFAIPSGVSSAKNLTTLLNGLSSSTAPIANPDPGEIDPDTGPIRIPVLEEAQQLVANGRNTSRWDWISGLCVQYTDGYANTRTLVGGNVPIAEGARSPSLVFSYSLNPLASAFLHGANRSQNAENSKTLDSAIGDVFAVLSTQYGSYSLLDEVIAAQLAAFHGELTAFDNAINQIDSGNLSSVTNTVGQLKDMRKTLASLLTSTTNILQLKVGILEELGRLDAIGK